MEAHSQVEILFSADLTFGYRPLQNQMLNKGGCTAPNCMLRDCWHAHILCLIHCLLLLLVVQLINIEAENGSPISK